MNLEKYRKDMLPAVEGELKAVAEFASADGASELGSMIRYHLGWEGEGAGEKAYGKRIRPQLVLLTCEAASGSWKKALPASTSVELLHNFSLIHDDIQDDSEHRRSRPTLWKKWGIPQAINAGDAMYSLAHLALERLIELNSLEVYSQCARQLPMSGLRLTQGQYLDLAYEKETSINVADYWPMVRGKTAALLSTCTTMGSICAGANKAQIKAYSKFGEKLGLAFQVHDDILGIWGDEKNTGKSVHNDLLNRKKSLPVLFGLEAKGKFQKNWEEWTVSSKNVRELAKSLEEDGAKIMAEAKTKELTNEALAALKMATPVPEAGTALKDLAIELVERSH